MGDAATLAIEYDQLVDVVTICGVRYAGELFRSLGFSEPGSWLRLGFRRDGVLTVDHVSPETERMFDAIAGKGAIAGKS